MFLKCFCFRFTTKSSLLVCEIGNSWINRFSRTISININFIDYCITILKISVQSTFINKLFFCGKNMIIEYGKDWQESAILQVQPLRFFQEFAVFRAFSFTFFSWKESIFKRLPLLAFANSFPCHVLKGVIFWLKALLMQNSKKKNKMVDLKYLINA